MSETKYVYEKAFTRTWHKDLMRGLCMGALRKDLMRGLRRGFTRGEAEKIGELIDVFYAIAVRLMLCFMISERLL